MDILPNEQLAQIAAPYDAYWVSSLGRIWSTKRNKWLKPWEHPTGHLYVKPCVEGKNHPKKVHRLVAITYIENPNDLPCVLHTNGDPSDNRVENLRWGTHSSNMKDMVRHGNSQKGSRHHNNKLTEEDVRVILSSKEKGVVLSQRYGVSPATISMIKNRKTWRHVKI